MSTEPVLTVGVLRQAIADLDDRLPVRVLNLYDPFFHLPAEAAVKAVQVDRLVASAPALQLVVTSFQP